MDLSVVIPAWNEAENLGILLPELHRTLQPMGLAYEIIVVDGRSTDGSRKVAEALGSRVLEQSEAGYGGALRDGFSEARGDYVLTMDADYSHDPSIAARLWAHRSEADLVIASRYLASGKAEMTILRLALSRALNGVYRWCLNLPFRDLSSGFRLYRGKALRQARTTARNFDVLPELLVQIHADGYRIREIPFHYRQRRRGRSHARLIRFGWAFVLTLGRMRRLTSMIAAQPLWHRRRRRIVGELRERGGPKSVGLDLAVRKLRV